MIFKSNQRHINELEQEISQLERKICELQESVEYYKLITDHVSDVIWILNLSQDKFTYISPSVYQLRGYTPEEAMQQSISQSLTPEYAEKIVELVAERFEKFERNPDEPTSYIDIIQQPCKNGNVIWVETSTQFQINSSGEIEVLGVSRDISKRKRSEERFRIIFEAAPDAYYLNDLKGNFVDGNEVAQRVIGYQKDELIGKNFLKLNLLPKKQLSKAGAILAKNVLGLSTGPDEFTLIRKDGSEVDVEIVTHPVKIEGQSLVLGIARDISKRKRVEIALRNNEEKMRSIFRVAPTGIGVVKDRFLQDVNPRICEMLGYSREELIGKNARILYPTQEDYEYVGDGEISPNFRARFWKCGNSLADKGW